MISFSLTPRGVSGKETFLGREVIDDEKRWTFLLVRTDNLEEAGERGRPGEHQWKQEVEGEATKKKLGL